MLVGCSERIRTNKALRKIQKHTAAIQDILKRYPNLVDTVAIIRHDTIYISKPGAELTAEENVDTWTGFKFDSVDSTARGFVDAVAKRDTVAKVQTAKKLQSKICPRVSKDTIIYILVKNSVVNHRIPIVFGVVAEGGKIKVYTTAADVRIPENVPVPQPRFDAPQQSLFSNIWFWVAVASWVVSVLVVTVSLKSRQRAQN